MKGEHKFKMLGKTLRRHSPTVLSGIAIGGVVLTGVSSAFSTAEAIEVLRRKDDDSSHRKALDVIRCYLPTVAIGASTIFCIAAANTLSRKQQALLTSAYTLLDSSYKEYRDKVKQIFGGDADDKVIKEIAKDRYKEEGIAPITGETLLFYEPHYGKLFERTMLEVQNAEYLLNRKFASDGEANVNDFLSFLGLPEIPMGDSMGWMQCMICDFSNPAWIDFEHTLTIMDDGMECYIINTSIPPMMDYNMI